MIFNVNDKITSSDNTKADVLAVFKKAVSNGQTRLALEALVDVIDSIVEFLISEPEEEIVGQVAPSTLPANVNAVEIKENKIEPASVETSTPSKKSVKETTKSISE